MQIQIQIQTQIQGKQMIILGFIRLMPPPSDHPATLLNGWLGNDNRVHLVIEKAHSCWRRKKFTIVCVCVVAAVDVFPLCAY